MAIYFAVAVLVLAAVAVCFVFWQKIQTDRQKLKMDLYDRRAAALLALTNAVEKVGEPIQIDDFAAPGMAPPFVSNYPERPFNGARHEPGIPNEVVIAFRYLFDDSVLEEVMKIHRLSIAADDGDRKAEKRLPVAFSLLLEKIEREMKVSQ